MICHLQLRKAIEDSNAGTLPAAPTAKGPLSSSQVAESKSLLYPEKLNNDTTSINSATTNTNTNAWPQMGHSVMVHFEHMRHLHQLSGISTQHFIRRISIIIMEMTWSRAITSMQDLVRRRLLLKCTRLHTSFMLVMQVWPCLGQLRVSILDTYRIVIE